MTPVTDAGDHGQLPRDRRHGPPRARPSTLTLELYRRAVHVSRDVAHRSSERAPAAGDRAPAPTQGLQAAFARGPSDPELDLALATRAGLGPGRALDGGVRDRLERGYGRPLGHVRVHDDAAGAAAAGRHGALALAVGDDVAFAPGAYRPGTVSGQALIAHEVAHTLQQRAAGTAPARAALEADATNGPAGALLHGRPWSPLGAGGLRLQACNGGTAAATGAGGGGGRSLLEGPQRLDPAGRWADVRRPGDYPHPSLVDGRMAIDSDGDQAADLSVGVSARYVRDPRPRIDGARLSLELLDRRDTRQEHVFPVPEHASPTPAGVRVQSTDGHEPTRFRLPDLSSPEPHELRLFPPQGTTTETTYRTQLAIAHFGRPAEVQDRTFRFASPPPVQRTVFAAAGPRETAPGLWTLDLDVGAYGDAFRLTLSKPDPGADRMLLSLSGINGDFVGPTVELTVGAVTGAARLAVVRTAGPRLELDINGDGTTDVTLFDLLEAERTWTIGAGPTDVARNRNHRITAYGPDDRMLGSGRFEVREGRISLSYGLGYSSQFAAIAQADAAQRLGEQATTGTVDAYLTNLERIRAAVRATAFSTPGLMPAGLEAGWNRLSNDLALAASGIDPARLPTPGPQRTPARLRTDVAASARDVLRILEATPEGARWTHEHFDEHSATSERPITGEHLSSHVATAALDRGPYLEALAAAALRGDWATAMREHGLAANGLDLLATARLEARGMTREVEQLRMVRALSPHVQQLAASNAIPVASMFYVREPDDPVGHALPSFPVPLFYWKQGAEWKLRCIVDTDDPFTVGLAAGAEGIPPHALFAQLGRRNRLPPGHLIYTIPGPTGRTSTVLSTSEWTASRIAGAVSAAIAVVGILAATGGAGSVAVTAIFAMSGVAGAVSGVAHIVEQAQDDSLTPRELLVDSVTIAGSLLGAASAVALEVRAAQTTIQAGRGVSQAELAFAQLNRVGMLAKPLTGAAIAADVTQLVLFTHDLVDGLRAIERNVPPGERARAVMLLLAQFAGMGGLMILGIRGSRAAYQGISGRLVVEIVNGVPMVRVHHGSLAADAYRQAFARVGVPEEVLRNVDVIVARNAEEFALATGNAAGTGTLVIRRGRAQLHVRDGASPEAVVHEADHLRQWADPRRRPLLAQLDEVTLADWSTLPPGRRATLHETRLRLEIDAQRGRLRDLEGQIHPGLPRDEATALYAEIDAAWRSIEQHRGQLVELAGFRARGSAGAEPGFLADPARLHHQPPGAAGAIDEHWLSLSRDEFIAEYNAHHPDTTLSDVELGLRYDIGQRLHPETGRLRLRDEELGARAQFRGVEQRVRTSPLPGDAPLLSAQQRRDAGAILAERDAGRAERRRLETRIPPDEVAIGRAQYRVVDASRRLGELHAEAWVHTRFGRGAERIERVYGGATSRSGDFDQVWAIWRRGAQDEWVVQLVVVEAKGGGSGLGARRAIDASGQTIYAEQGSRPYFDSILASMTRGNADMQSAAARIRAAPSDKVHYVLVKVPIEGDTASTVSTVIVREFDI